MVGALWKVGVSGNLWNAPMWSDRDGWLLPTLYSCRQIFRAEAAILGRFMHGRCLGFAFFVEVEAET